METKTVTRRTGGRSAQVLIAVRDAVEDLIEEHGRERVTVPMVAEKAGVNPTSIYRRWGDLPSLINEMATYRLDPARPLPDTGSLRGDLIAWADGIVSFYSNPVNAAVLRGGAATAGDGETDCTRNRRGEATAIMARYPDAGLTIERIVNGITAPIVYRAIFQPWTLDEKLAETLVDQLI